jgi:hypothetical protein
MDRLFFILLLFGCQQTSGGPGSLVQVNGFFHGTSSFLVGYIAITN